MLRLRALVVLLALFLPPASGAALASPLRHDHRASVDWPQPLVHIVPVAVLGVRHALPRVRLFMMEVAILPSGRLVIRTVVTRPYRPEPRPAPHAQPILLPLPATWPLVLVGAAGLVAVGRRRAARPLAGRRRHA
jgi:hypothetical protein